MLVSNKLHFKSLFSSIKYKLLALLLLSLLVGYFDNQIILLEELSMSIPAFLSTTIIVSLAFKTNKAYGRWWEAKRIWEEIGNSTRSWTRLISVYLYNDHNSEKMVDKLIHNQILWTTILKNRLRKLPLNFELSDLSEDEISFLKSVDNANQGLLLIQGKELKNIFDKGEIPILIHKELEEILQQLEVWMGKAERIKNTDFPTPYNLIINWTIYLFCIMFTYFISDKHMFYEVSVSFLISSIFISIAHISSTLQDPFENGPSDTPMDYICHKINEELKDFETVNHQAFIQPNSTSHYIM